MTTQHPYPILEYDPNPDAIIRPERLIEPIGAPEHCVICFFGEVIASLVQSGQARQIAAQRSEIGEHPVYELDVAGRRLALFHPGVGAPLVAGLLEEVICLGARKFVACGGCGVLDRKIAAGHIIVPVSAVRDEGTSYHYLPPSREVFASPEGVAAIANVLTRYGISHLLGKTWTTDAIYRETPEKVALRRAEGCQAVEMEAAAFFAVAQHRGVTLAQMLYAGDDVSGAEWDHREWQRLPVRERLFWLAAEACLML
jgi:uridine phosphorylase